MRSADADARENSVEVLEGGSFVGSFNGLIQTRKLGGVLFCPAQFYPTSRSPSPDF